MTEEEEEYTETDLAIQGFNNVVSIMTGVASNVRNVRYNAQTNTTTYYGHTNFEELKVNGNSVALASQIPDISGKSNIGHTHELNEVVLTYEEEEETINEEEEVEIRTITKTKPLNDVLDGKADYVHTHSSADIANWAIATENFAKLNASNTFSGTQT